MTHPSKYDSTAPKEYSQMVKRLYEFFGEKFAGKLSQDVSDYPNKMLKPMTILEDLKINIHSIEDLTPAIKRVLKLIAK